MGHACMNVEFFLAVNLQIMIFRFMTPCCLVPGNQLFGRTLCPWMATTCFAATSLFTFKRTRCQNLKIVNKNIHFSLWHLLCLEHITKKWRESVTCTLVLEPCCLQSDCRSVTLVDEQTPSLVSWSENHIVFCLTVSLLHWLMNRLCHLVPGIRKMFCVGSRTVWWTNPIT